VDEASVTQYITGTFDGVHPVEAWGDTFFFYNPGSTLPDEIYFATLKSKDDEYDRFSNLDRPSVFRLNIGISKATYRALFGAPPSRRGTDNVADTLYDFTALDQLLPHPVYGRMYWVCVLNPSDAMFETVQPLLAEAYDLAVGKYAKRAARA
jgi:hypothetical protein